MKTTAFILCGSFCVAAATASLSFAADNATGTSNNPGKPVTVQVSGGTVTFDAGTNLSAVTVHGKSAALQARVQAHRGSGGLTLDQVEAWVPVKAISTGMNLRDEHMRKYIFTTSAGQQPDLKFSAGNIVCPTGQGHEAACQVAGTMTIRGVERPFATMLKVRQENQGYRATGDGTVRLSDYGIERPSQLGVTSADEIKFHLEFSGKEIAGGQESAQLREAR